MLILDIFVGIDIKIEIDIKIDQDASISGIHRDCFVFFSLL